jgi:peptide/nickel transport system ATP-binding protein
MYLGKIVEIGPAEQIYADPKHPYTVSLLKAIPEPDPTRTVPRDVPRGEVPDAVVPPLGCSFHPRCPRAFEVCGWESRDLRFLLEQRWTKLPEAEYESERAVIGDLGSLDQPGAEGRLNAARGATGAEVEEILERLRSDAPEDPFWKGVTGIEADGEGVTVRFNDWLDPRDVESNGVRLQCHLYDEKALARARQLAASGGYVGESLGSRQ